MENLTIDLSSIGDELFEGANVIGLIKSAKAATSKAGNQMVKLVLEVVSVTGAGTTIFHQIMLADPKDKMKTMNWRARARKDFATILGYKADNLDLAELHGKAVEFKVTIDPEWGPKVKQFVRAVDAEEVEAAMPELEFEDGDGNDLAY